MNVSDIPNWKKPIVNAGSTEAGLPVAIRQIKELNWMRPHDALGYEINDVVEAAESLGKNEPVANPDTSGNAAAMREALVKIIEHSEREIGCTCNAHLLAEYSWYLHEAKAALAAPPRNCDVWTAEEQRKRFDEFCERHTWDEIDGSHCTLSCPLYHGEGAKCDELEWAQMPYEEGGAA